MQRILRRITAAVFCLGLLYILACSIGPEREGGQAELKSNYNGELIRGSFDSGISEGKAEGEGVFTCAAESEVLSVAGTFEKGDANGDVTVRFADGSSKRGEMKEGFWNGEVITRSEETILSREYYRNGIQEGYAVYYDDGGKPERREWYYRGRPLSDLMEETEQTTKSRICGDPAAFLGGLVRLEGKVKSVNFEEENTCLELEDENGWTTCVRVYPFDEEAAYRTVFSSVLTGTEVRVLGQVSMTGAGEEEAGPKEEEAAPEAQEAKDRAEEAKEETKLQETGENNPSDLYVNALMILNEGEEDRLYKASSSGDRKELTEEPCRFLGEKDRFVCSVRDVSLCKEDMTSRMQVLCEGYPMILKRSLTGADEAAYETADEDLMTGLTIDAGVKGTVCMPLPEGGIAAVPVLGE